MAGPQLLGDNHEVSRVYANRLQLDALETLFNSQPIIRACRAVIVGQLVSNGFDLWREGKRVSLTSEFSSHLQKHWLPFVQDVVDSFLVAGYAAVAYEPEEDDGYEGHGKSKGPLVDVPVVAPLDTYDLAFDYTDSPFRRRYQVIRTTGAMAQAEETHEEGVDVHVATRPDAAGNVVSPVATCHELWMVDTAMFELARQAESHRARPLIITQPAPVKNSDDPIGSAGMFFDSESREIQASLEADSNRESASALSMQLRLCDVINRMQTRNTQSERAEFDAARGRRGGSTPANSLPPVHRPELFSLPKEHVGAGGGFIQAEARGDLVSVSQHAFGAFCSAMGVPSGLILESRFVGNQTNYLRLLNTTVEQLASHVQRVVTRAFARCGYARTPSDVLSMAISPMAAIADVTALVQAGVAEVAHVQRLALRSLGVSNEEIEVAAKRTADVRSASDAAASAAVAKVP